MRPSNQPQVAYWNNMPTPYMVERFNAVACRGNLDLEAWFNVRLPAHRSWELDESHWLFHHRYIPSAGLGDHRFNIPTPLLRRNPPDVLVSLYAEPTFVAGWAIARMRSVRTAFWAQVTFDSWVPRTPWREWFKRRLFPRVDATLGSGEQSREFAMRYGTAPERALLLPHSIDVEHFACGARAACSNRDEMRDELGLRGTTFIYVGRLWKGKGLDHLLDAFAVLQRQCDEKVSLVLVGDGPEEPRLKERVRSECIENVVFAGFKQKPDLPRYYAMSDAFVFPTLGDPYGLVVDEAMACSLPVISTSAAGEIEDRVEDGENGFVVPPANSAALFDRMRLLARNPAMRSRMGELSAKQIAGNTPEKWAEDFELAIERILKLPPAGEDA